MFNTQSSYVFSCSVFFPFTCTKPSQGAATLKPGLRRPVKASGRGAAAGRSLFDESQRRRPVLILLRLETSHLISVGIDKRPRAPKRRERQSGGEVTQTSPNDPGLARGQGGGCGQGPEGGHETLRDSGASQARERRSVRQGRERLDRRSPFVCGLSALRTMRGYSLICLHFPPFSLPPTPPPPSPSFGPLRATFIRKSWCGASVGRGLGVGWGGSCPTNRSGVP